MSSTPTVVVTGLGATTPLGGTMTDTWEAVLAGRSGARPIAEPWVAEHELPVTFAATIAVPPEEVLTKVELRRNDSSTQYALVAAREAWADAGAPEVEPERLGVSCGTGIGGVQTLLSAWDTLREKASQIEGFDGTDEDVLTYAMFPAVAEKFFTTRHEGPQNVGKTEAQLKAEKEGNATALRGPIKYNVTVGKGAPQTVSVEPA